MNNISASECNTTNCLSLMEQQRIKRSAKVNKFLCASELINENFDEFKEFITQFFVYGHFVVGENPHYTNSPLVVSERKLILYDLSEDDLFIKFVDSFIRIPLLGLFYYKNRDTFFLYTETKEYFFSKNLLEKSVFNQAVLDD